MCGIAGLWNLGDGAPASEALLDAMCRAMRHRGPDDQGIQCFGAFGMGMRRLSIIDLADGHQPMSNEDGSVTVVLNGEIYNYLELREALVKAGHCFRTHSDTEVLVHLYEDYGVKLFDHLRGMYAFAIWDAARQRLLLGRDPAGKKPLYLFRQGRTLAFASELKCFKTLPAFCPDLDEDALAAYLFLGYVPEPRSIFRSVRKVPPGHALSITAGTEHLEAHWTIPPPDTAVPDEPAEVEQLHALLRESVRLRLRSDVPLGAFLSGGLDSSLVVALMRELGHEVHTYSIGFDDAGFNELPYARKVAEHLGTQHQEWVVRPQVAEDFESIVRQFDEPFADSSAIPTWYVCREAARHVKVVLTGDGGDEVFGGYLPYQLADLLRHLRWLPAPLVRASQVLCSRLVPESTAFDSPGRRLRRIHRALLRSVPAAHADIMAWNPAGTVRELLGQPASADFGTAYLLDMYARSPGTDPVLRLMQTDFQSYLPGDILVKTDRMSMMHSIELRSPLLDREVVARMFRVPGTTHVRGRNGKRLLKAAAARLLPPEILNRPKHGFMIPVGRWMKEDLRDRVHEGLLGTDSQVRDRLDERVIHRLVHQHQSGQRDCTHELWNLLCLDVWFRAWKEGR